MKKVRFGLLAAPLDLVAQTDLPDESTETRFAFDTAKNISVVLAGLLVVAPQ